MPLGGLITLAVLLPNLLYLRFPPTAIPPETSSKDRVSKFMEIIERIGQAGCFLIPFFYQLPPLREASVDSLAVMVLALLLYYSGWARYMTKGHRFVLLFAPLLGVPLPMALSPVIYFAAASIFLHAWPLAAAAALLAAGHLFVSWSGWKRCNQRGVPQAY